MPEGHEVVFEGEGDESPDWEAGDVVLRVRSSKDKGGWRRKESSLYWKETIGVHEVCHVFLFPSSCYEDEADSLRRRRSWVSIET